MEHEEALPAMIIVTLSPSWPGFLHTPFMVVMRHSPGKHPTASDSKRKTMGAKEGLMRISHHETISQILEACSLLILLTEKAHEMESRGEACMLDYGLIHGCASKIQAVAEQRREDLARLQWNNEVDGMARDLEKISFRCAN